MNARRYYFDSGREYPRRQLHIRAWDQGEHVEIDAHEEPAPLQHPRKHLQSTDMTDATDWVVDRIDNGNGLDPRGFKPRPMPYVYSCDDCGTRGDTPAIVGEFTESWFNGTVQGGRLSELGFEPGDLITLCGPCTEELLTG